MPYPTFFVGASLALFLITLLIRRWQRTSALVGATFSLSLAAWTWLSLSAQTAIGFGWVDLFGSTGNFDFAFRLQPNNEPAILFCLLLVGLTLLATALAPQNDLMSPFALLLQIGYGGMLLLVDAPIEPLLITPLLLAGMTAIGLYLLYNNRPDSNRLDGNSPDSNSPDPMDAVNGREGIGNLLRSLLPPILAFPFFLIAAWYGEQILLNPQNETLYEAVGWLLAFGLILLLAPVPLHSSQPMNAQHSLPLALALLTMLYQLVVLFLVFQIGIQFSYIGEVSPFALWLTAGGVATAVWGGLAAAGTMHPGRLWGYALLHDWGIILLILAVSGDESWSLALFLFALRGVSMLTAAVGLAQIHNVAGSLRLSNLQGVGSRLPWTTTAFLLGGLGLAGFPLSAGFTGHWAALQTVAITDWRIAAIVLLASAGVIFGFIRLVRVLFGPLKNHLIPRESAISVGAALVVILLSVSLALTPQLLEGPVRWATIIFSQ